MISVSPEVCGLIFDCDGTLADTMPIHIEAWCDTFADYGISPCPKDFINQCKGRPVEVIVDTFNRQFNHRLDTVKFAAEKNRKAHRNLARARAIEPVAEVVRRFKGRLPMAVASGGIRKNVDLIIQAIGFKDHFETIITSDDDVKPKPSADIFLEAARRMQVEPTACQVFEDGDAGLEAARKAGMVATDVRLLI